MEEEIEKVDAPLCRCCKEPYKLGDEFCNNCGFPFNGTEKEQGHHIGKYLVKVNTKKDGNASILGIKIALLSIAVLLIFASLRFADMGEEGATVLVSNIVLAFVLFGIALWSDKSPFNAYLTGLIIFLSLQIITFFISPYSVLGGLILKLVLIGLLIGGLISAANTKQE